MLTAYAKINSVQRTLNIIFTLLLVAISKIYFAYVSKRNKQTGNRS